jgi:hypothetical protein
VIIKHQNFVIYNWERRKETEAAKMEALVAKAKEVAEKIAFGFEEGMDLLADIARGTAKLFTVESIPQVIVPTFSEQMRAIQIIFDVRGFSKRHEQRGEEGPLQINVLNEETKRELQKLIEQTSE